MTASPVHEIAVRIESERRDALLSALRRGAAGEAAELLDGWDAWHVAEIEACDEDEDEDDGTVSIDWRVLDLSGWVRAECRRHVDDGRFQHALALLERYLVLPPLLTAAAEAARQRMSRR